MQPFFDPTIGPQCCRIDSRSGGIFDKSDVNIASISTTTGGLLLDVLGRGPHFGRPYQLKLPWTLPGPLMHLNS